MKLNQIVAFLTLVAALLNQNTVSALKAGTIGAKDNTLFVRKQITGANVVKLIDGTTERVTGITNIDGNKLDDYRNFIIEAISIRYGTHASDTDPGIISYTTAPPTALRNAELVLRQGNRLVINMPVHALLPGVSASPASVDGDRFKNMVWALIAEGQKFELNLEFAEGASFGANNHFVEVNLHGAETYLKANA